MNTNDHTDEISPYLICYDAPDYFKAPLSVVKMSGFIAKMIEDVREKMKNNNAGDADNDNSKKNPIKVGIHLPDDVNFRMLVKVVTFCEHYYKVEPMAAIEMPLKSQNMGDLIQPWYADFVSDIAAYPQLLHQLLKAAHYMDIKPLMYLACAAVINNPSVPFQTQNAIWGS